MEDIRAFLTNIPEQRALVIAEAQVLLGRLGEPLSNHIQTFIDSVEQDTIGGQYGVTRAMNVLCETLNINERPWNSQNDPLEVAIYQQDEKRIMELLPGHHHALMAMRADLRQVISYLLPKLDFLHDYDMHGRPLLLWAAHQASAEILKSVMDYHQLWEQINSPFGPQKKYLLQEAVEGNNVDNFYLLIKHKASLSTLCINQPEKYAIHKLRRSSKALEFFMILIRCDVDFAPLKDAKTQQDIREVRLYHVGL